MRVLAFMIMAFSSASAVHAEDAVELEGDVVGFETCFIQMMIDNPDNPMLELAGPVICGERNIPMGQSCDALGYMLFDRREACKQEDLAFWQAQVEARNAAAVEEGRHGTGFDHEQGLERCRDEVETESERLDCNVELYWRTTMMFVAADLVASLVEEAQ